MVSINVMGILYSFGIFFGNFFHLGADINSPCGGDNWVAFKDEKCFKLIKNYSPRDQTE